MFSIYSMGFLRKIYRYTRGPLPSSFPSLSFLPSSTSPLKVCPSSPLLSLEVSPLLWLVGLGECLSSPSGSGWSPAAKCILVHFRHKFAPFWLLWLIISHVCCVWKECYRDMSVMCDTVWTWIIVRLTLLLVPLPHRHFNEIWHHHHTDQYVQSSIQSLLSSGSYT